MDQQPGRRLPARQGQGRPPTPEELSRMGRQPGAPEEYYDEQPNVVRPFVRQAEEDGWQYQQDQYQEGQYQEEQYPQEQYQQDQYSQDQYPQEQAPPGYGGGPGGAPAGAPVPGPGPAPAPGPRSSLIPTPMPAPRAVARQIRPGDRAPVPAQRPMSDLTTTMPILVVPSDDGDGFNAPPGEHGHFHDEGDNGRHRGDGRSPRALKAAAILIGVVAAGAAVAGTFGGGSGKSASPQAAGGTTTGAPPAAEAAVPDVSSSQAAAPAAASSTSPTPTPTPTRSTKSPTPTPKPTNATSSTSGSPAMAPRPSSAPPTTPSSAPSTPPSTPVSTASTTSSPAPPAFTTLRYGDSGAAVSKLQSDLLAAGYGWALNGYRNGQFDDPTQRAVSYFQQDHRGTARADGGYGVYGPATNQALQNAIGGATGG